jgi:hypothetical protein
MAEDRRTVQLKTVITRGAIVFVLSFTVAFVIRLLTDNLWLNALGVSAIGGWAGFYAAHCAWPD